MLHIYKIIKVSNLHNIETDCAVFSTEEDAINALNGIFKFNHNIDYEYRIKKEEIDTNDKSTLPNGCRINVNFDSLGNISNLVYDITTDSDIVDDKDYLFITKNGTFGEGYMAINDGETPEDYRKRVISFIKLNRAVYAMKR